MEQVEVLDVSALKLDPFATSLKEQMTSIHRYTTTWSTSCLTTRSIRYTPTPVQQGLA